MLRNVKFQAFSALFSALLLAFTPGMASADEYSDVQGLIRNGKFADAVVKADQFLVTKPRDAQMRFFKGVALTEQNKSAEAIALYIKMSEDFPEIPEPYNNLAVLYASAGQYDKARASLEMAIRTNPSYSTAHENLGDVYSKLAQASYGKALSIEQSNAGAQTKLTIIREMFSAKGTPVAAPVAVAMARPAPPPMVAAPVAPPAAVRPAPVAPAVAAPAVAAPAVVAAAPAASMAKPAVAPPVASPPAPAASADEKAVVITAVQNWAAAWSNKDVKGYLAAYAKDFTPASGGSRSAWETERRARIEGKGRIEVKVSQPEVTIVGDTATIRFRQEYDSDRLSTSSRKTLVLAKAPTGWQIKQEIAGR